MIYDGEHILWGFPLKLAPTGGSYATSPFSLRLAGLGNPLSFSARATSGGGALSSGTPQDAEPALLTYAVSPSPVPLPAAPSPVVSPSAMPAPSPCATCNLTPIPYNPSLPVLRAPMPRHPMRHGHG